ncbi:MAG: porin [bacterium]
MRLGINILVFIFFSSYANCEDNVISEKSKMTFAGLVHIQYLTSNIKDIGYNNTFTLKRAELGADFKNTILHGNIQVNFGQGVLQLKDGYGDLQFSPTINLKLGQYKKPFSLLALTGDSKDMFIEKGNNTIGADKTGMFDYASTLKYSGRDVGAMVYGQIRTIDYAIGVFNGNGDNKKYDEDSGKQCVGRIVLKPIKDVGVGISASNLYKDKETYQAFNVDVEYKKGDFWFQGETDYGNNYIISDTTYFMGIGLILGKWIKVNLGHIYSLFPALRFDYTFSDKDDGETANMLVTPGININFDEHSYHRLMLNLDVNQPLKENTDIQLGFKMQLQILI